MTMPSPRASGDEEEEFMMGEAPTLTTTSSTSQRQPAFEQQEQEPGREHNMSSHSQDEGTAVEEEAAGAAEDELAREEEEEDVVGEGGFSREKGDSNDDGVFSDDEETNNEQEERGIEESRMFRLLMRGKCCVRLLRNFPRLFSLFLGVVIPLFSLIFISFFMGNGLSKLEGQEEIDYNDAILAAKMRARIYSFLIVNTTVLIPPKCAEFFLQERGHNAIVDEFLGSFFDTTLSDTFEAHDELANAATPSEELKEQFVNGTSVIRDEELYNYMKTCGENVRNSTQHFYDRIQDELDQAAAGLTFNWVRCYEGAEGSHDFFARPNPDYRPEAQASFFEDSWKSDQERLFAQYFNESMNLNRTNMNMTNVTAQAYKYSIQQATGGNSCNTNGPSGAWFWFEIMTTVGYGNQSPQTFGGIMMIYTLGFLSILAFGAILASSGGIVSRIFDDAARRAKLQFLTWPWFACLVWGMAYYSWMALIAVYTKYWKRSRLGNDTFSMADGYWFSYISTTTIGLGDIILEPEVIVGVDLVIFPLLFLIGFTFFSAFLGKFGEGIVVVIKGNKKGLVETLLDQMDKAHPATNASPQQEMSSEAEMVPNKSEKKQSLPKDTTTS